MCDAGPQRLLTGLNLQTLGELELVGSHARGYRTDVDVGVMSEICQGDERGVATVLHSLIKDSIVDGDGEGQTVETEVVGHILGYSEVDFLSRGIVGGVAKDDFVTMTYDGLNKNRLNLLGPWSSPLRVTGPKERLSAEEPQWLPGPAKEPGPQQDGSPPTQGFSLSRGSSAL